jgi:hypothetical protein
METDKELALRLVDRLEEYYLRNTLLETILDSAEVSEWRQMLDEVLPLPAARETARRIFRPVRERILEASDLTTAVRELLNTIKQ